MMKNKF